MAEAMVVEVAYALPERQLILKLMVPEGTSVATALELSGIQREFPDLDLATAPVGIFGQVCERDTPLRPGDRVEIYRPLIADPREQRRQRVAQGKRMGRGGDY